MSQFQPNHQTSLQHSVNHVPQIDQPIIYVNDSDHQVMSIDMSSQFQSMNASQSQQGTSTFNELTESQSQQAKQQETVQQGEQQNQQQETTQQVQPEIIEQPKPQSIKPVQKAVDYEGLVSLKIFEKKINDSLELKNEGNDFFRTNRYQQAIQKYLQGLRILDPQQFYGATQAECQKMAEVSASLLFNIGSCFFNINSWKQAEVYFTQTITINSNHIKAIYKRALCRYELQNYEDSMTDIKLAFNKDRSNVQIHKSYEKILQKYNEELKKAKEDMKQISSKIFKTESQKSINLSSSKEQKKLVEEQQNIDIHSGEEQSGLWGFAPLVLVGVGAALLYGYKKWFSK